MKNLFNQHSTFVNSYNFKQVDLENAFASPFPTVLTNMYLPVPEDVLWPRAIDLDYQVDVVWDNNLQVLREPRVNEVATYGLKPTVSCPSAKILSFVAVNDYLLTAFAKQSLALPVLNNALVWVTKGHHYQLLVKNLDQHSRQVSLEQLTTTLLKQASAPSWESFCGTLRKYLPQTERQLFLKQLWYRVLINCEIDPSQLVRLTQDNQAVLAPFSGVIPKGVNELITLKPNPQDSQGMEWAFKTPVNTPQDFWQLVTAMKVKPAVFKKAARDLLCQWTYILPEFIAQLQPLVEGLRFKKSLCPRGASHKQCWADYLKHQHQLRVKDLEAQGWYTDLNLPAPTAGYPVSQQELFDKPPQSEPRRPRQRHPKHTQRCNQAEKSAVQSQLLFK